MKKKKNLQHSLSQEILFYCLESVLLEASGRSRNLSWRKDFATKVTPYLKKQIQVFAFNQREAWGDLFCTESLSKDSAISSVV